MEWNRSYTRTHTLWVWCFTCKERFFIFFPTCNYNYYIYLNLLFLPIIVFNRLPVHYPTKYSFSRNSRNAHPSFSPTTSSVKEYFRFVHRVRNSGSIRVVSGRLTYRGHGTQRKCVSIRNHTGTFNQTTSADRGRSSRTRSRFIIISAT